MEKEKANIAINGVDAVVALVGPLLNQRPLSVRSSALRVIEFISRGDRIRTCDLVLPKQPTGQVVIRVFGSEPMS